MFRSRVDLELPAFASNIYIINNHSRSASEASMSVRKGRPPVWPMYAVGLPVIILVRLLSDLGSGKAAMVGAVVGASVQLIIVLVCRASELRRRLRAVGHVHGRPRGDAHPRTRLGPANDHGRKGPGPGRAGGAVNN